MDEQGDEQADDQCDDERRHRSPGPAHLSTLVPTIPSSQNTLCWERRAQPDRAQPFLVGRSLPGSPRRSSAGAMATPTDRSPIPAHDLKDGRATPQLGLGIYAMNGPEGVDAIVNAVDTVGYRLLDTAVNCENEREVGEAVANSAVDREKLFVTSKIPGRHHGFDESIASTEESLARLSLD